MAGHRRAGPSGASGDDGGGGGDSESKSEDPFHVRNWSENPTNIAVSSRAAAVCAVNESTLSNPAVSLALGDRLSKRWRGFTACVDALVIGDGNLQAACKLGDNVVALCKSNAAASGADWNQLFSTAVGDRKWRRIKADLRQQDHQGRHGRHGHGLARGGGGAGAPGAAAKHAAQEARRRRRRRPPLICCNTSVDLFVTN